MEFILTVVISDCLPSVQESGECLRHLTQQAVVLQKKMNDIYQVIQLNTAMLFQGCTYYILYISYVILWRARRRVVFRLFRSSPRPWALSWTCSTSSMESSSSRSPSRWRSFFIHVHLQLVSKTYWKEPLPASRSEMMENYWRNTGNDWKIFESPDFGNGSFEGLKNKMQSMV